MFPGSSLGQHRPASSRILPITSFFFYTEFPTQQRTLNRCELLWRYITVPPGDFSITRKTFKVLAKHSSLRVNGNLLIVETILCYCMRLLQIMAHFFFIRYKHHPFSYTYSVLLFCILASSLASGIIVTG